jgi:alkylation response protein AidB-like acyl-CoA dehydrogenase
MARADDGSVVTAIVDRPSANPGLHAGQPQALAVMDATATVALAFDGLEVADADVVGVQSDAAWRRRDRAGSAMPPAAPLGIAARAIRLLRERPHTDAAVASLDADLDDRRAGADEVAAALAAAIADDRDIDDLTAHGADERDRGLALARRATDALVAASGGGAIARSHPAQRLSREATFYLIQAQTGDLRAATLARAARRD